MSLIDLMIIDQIMQPKEPRSWLTATLIFVLLPITIIFILMMLL